MTANKETIHEVEKENGGVYLHCVHCRFRRKIDGELIDCSITCIVYQKYPPLEVDRLCSSQDYTITNCTSTMYIQHNRKDLNLFYKVPSNLKLTQSI